MNSKCRHYVRCFAWNLHSNRPIFIQAQEKRRWVWEENQFWVWNCEIITVLFIHNVQINIEKGCKSKGYIVHMNAVVSVEVKIHWTVDGVEVKPTYTNLFGCEIRFIFVMETQMITLNLWNFHKYTWFSWDFHITVKLNIVWEFKKFAKLNSFLFTLNNTRVKKSLLKTAIHSKIFVHQLQRIFDNHGKLLEQKSTGYSNDTMYSSVQYA